MVATPCPLLIAIPVAIIGSVSLAARRGIIIKDPAVLEKVGTCRTAIFDKTGTLTYGQPETDRIAPGEGWQAADVLPLVASLERYSKHPLAARSLDAAERKRVTLAEAGAVSELPGEGLSRIGRRPGRAGHQPQEACRPHARAGGRSCLPQPRGLECVVIVDDQLCGDTSVPRSTAAGRRAVRSAPADRRHQFEPRHAGLRRPGIGGALSGRAGRHHGGVRGTESRNRSWRS